MISWFPSATFSAPSKPFHQVKSSLPNLHNYKMNNHYCWEYQTIVLNQKIPLSRHKIIFSNPNQQAKKNAQTNLLLRQDFFSLVNILSSFQSGLLSQNFMLRGTWEIIQGHIVNPFSARHFYFLMSTSPHVCKFPNESRIFRAYEITLTQHFFYCFFGQSEAFGSRNNQSGAFRMLPLT